MTIPPHPSKDDAQNVQLKVEVAPGPLPRVEAANWFSFAGAGNDFQLLIGYIDPIQVANAVAQSTKTPIRPEITHRLFLGQHGMQQLRASLDEIVRNLGLAQLPR